VSTWDCSPSRSPTIPKPKYILQRPIYSPPPSHPLAYKRRGAPIPFFGHYQHTLSTFEEACSLKTLVGSRCVWLHPIHNNLVELRALHKLLTQGMECSPTSSSG